MAAYVQKLKPSGTCRGRNYKRVDLWPTFKNLNLKISLEEVITKRIYMGYFKRLGPLGISRGSNYEGIDRSEE